MTTDELNKSCFDLEAIVKALDLEIENESKKDSNSDKLFDLKLKRSGAQWDLDIAASQLENSCGFFRLAYIA